MENKKRNSSWETRTVEGFPVIAINGYFDEQLALEVVKTAEDLLRNGKTALILDFTKCIAVNSLAVGNLQFLTMKIIDDFRGRLVLAKILPVMERVFELASIIPYAEVTKDVATAVAVLKGSPSPG